MKYLVFLLILVSITPGTIAPVRGQQQQQQQQRPTPDDVVRITTNLVQLDAVVTDKSGNQIKDLSAGDFEVLQDGKPQKIVSVFYVTPKFHNERGFKPPKLNHLPKSVSHRHRHPSTPRMPRVY